MQKTHFLVLFIALLLSFGAAAQNPVPTTRTSHGKIQAPELDELSGIVASVNNPGSFWVHNDSGDKARFFLIDSTAQLQRTFYLEGVQAIDMEDIAWVQRNGENYLILADIGDNLGRRQDIRLYLVKEPKLAESKTVDTIRAAAIETKVLQYPGKARDSEALFVDPLDNKLYMVSKREFQSALYTADIFGQERSSYQLREVLKFPFTFITAADMAMDRRAVLMKNLTTIFYWPIGDQEPLVKALAKPSVSLQYDPEPQGEAITFSREDEGFFTISERPFGLDSYLYHYHTKP